MTSLLEKANDTNLLLVELEMPSVLRHIARFLRSNAAFFLLRRLLAYS
jgi:hypothetical protein